MRQKHLKGKEMKPVCLLSKAILKGYKSAGCKYSFLQLLFLSCTVFSFPSERTQRVTELNTLRTAASRFILHWKWNAGMCSIR